MSFTNVFTSSTIYPTPVSLAQFDLTASVVLYWPLEAPEGEPIAAEIVEITSSDSASWSITIPDARQVSVGQTILFNNLSGFTITIKNQSGGTVVALGSGEQWQIYLGDNTTANGEWRIYQYGAGVSYTNAAALAGNGLQADGAKLETTIVQVEISTDTTFDATDRAKFYNWTGAIGELTLPDPTVVLNDWYMLVRNSGTGDIDLVGPDGELINDSVALTLAPGDSATVICDGTNFYTVGLGQTAIFAFDYILVDVTGSTDYTLTGNELNRIAYQFIGTMGANFSVIVPPTTQQYWVYNNTGGSFDLSIQTATQVTPLLMTNGLRTIVYCDGTDVVPAVTAFVIGAVDGGTF